MKTKKFTKVSARILMALLAVVMVFSSAASTLGVTVAAESDVFWKNEAIHTDYKSYFDGSVVQKLPDTVGDHEIISVIVKLDTPTLMEAYNLTDKAISFGEYVNTDEAGEIKKEIQREKEAYIKALTRRGISCTAGLSYANVLAGFEVLFEAKHFENACKDLAIGAKAIVGEVYNVSETQLVENKVSIYEETGIFDSSSFKYDGSGMVVAVLDTGLDYTHPAFAPEALTSNKLGLTKDEVADHISNTAASTRVPGLTADDVYINDKVPFSFDYADNDSDVYSLHNNHGTHVSGVIVGHDDVITGVAPNAQLVSMKIFSDTQDSARASWILAALEDCVELGVDVINMSLGTACGFSRESDQEEMSGVYDDIRALGISLIVAASNSFNSAYGSEKNGNLGLTSNPDTSTVGSPSTYEGAMSVASINGTKTPYLLDSNGTIIYFVESSDSAGEEKHFVEELIGKSKDTHELEYVLIPGIGSLSNYEGIDVAGKIALVRRGTNTFEEKANAAQRAGAKALIVYNNTSGDIRMNVGITSIPVCSISQDDGEALAATKGGILKVSNSQSSGPFMSDFSSWGPSPSLGIKPEITAHGGNILSAVTGHGYDRLSGTSMACPNMAGVYLLLRQYVIDEFKDQITKPNGDIDYVEVNSIVNRLLMSTADIVNNKNGIPYAVRKQGAGLANLTDAALTKAYILTYDRLDGSVMDKTKIELGDDPNKTGIYTLNFTIHNFGTTALSYNISASVMTEGVSKTPTYDGETVVTEEGYVLSGASVKVTSVSGGSRVGASGVTVAPGHMCDVVVTITLSDADKEYIDKSFANGMYVEGFVNLTAKDAGSTDLNVPYLTFYGNWYRAPLFDLDYFETNADELDDSIALLDKTLPDAYATRPIGGISDDYVSYLGSYYFVQDPSSKIIAATRDYIALSNTEGTIHSLRFVWGGLLRNASRIDVTICDSSTGEVVFKTTEKLVRKSYGDGGSYIYPANIDIEFDAAELNLRNNAQYMVKLQGYLDYDDGTGVNKTPTENLNSTFEFPITIDFEAPAITDVQFYSEYDKDAKKTRLYAELAVYDNHYAMSMQVGYIGLGSYIDETTGEQVQGNMMFPFDNYMVPIYSERNGTTYVTYELTDFIYDIKHKGIASEDQRNTFAVSVYDYAINEATYEIALPDDFTELYLKDTEIVLNPNEVYTIDANVYPDTEWAELLEYSTSSNAVRIVNNKIVAVKPGGASRVTIYDPKSDKEVSMLVKVRKEGDEGYKEISKPVADVFELKGYDTLKAFYFLSNEDRDIGEEGDSVLFTGDRYNLSFFPSESVKINYKLDAYFPEDTEVEFTSSNNAIVKVTEDGVITALSEGFASISVKVLQDGKATYTAKTISIEVKDPYVRTGPTLNNYYGIGANNDGIVDIPESMLFTRIGQYAFSNYDYIPKDLAAGDEISEEDPDATKITYIGNDDIKEVIIPEGVEAIDPFAFANLTALERVVLPSTIESIEYGAFFGCTKLKTVEGLEHVKIINQSAFQYCNIQGSLSLDSIHAVGDYAFAGNRALKSVTFPTTLSSIGAYAFAWNNALTDFDVSASGNVKYGPYVFMDCKSLEEITIDTNVIPSGAFYNCEELTTVNISKNVSTIGEYAFTGTDISKFSVAEGNTTYRPSSNKDYLLSADGNTLLLVAPSAKGEFTLGGVMNIGHGAFSGNEKITSVNMPDITYVGDYAFSECRGLTSVNLGLLTNVGKYAFFITDITEIPALSDSIKSIGDYAFAFSYIETLDLGKYDGLIIGEGAFCECTKLTSVVIGNNAVIGKSAFLRGTTTEDPRRHGYSLNIGEKAIEDIETGFYKLEYLSNLNSLTIGSGAVIGDSAFFGSANLKTVSLGDGAIIGNMAFYNCASLFSIDLSKVRSIGDMAFSGDNNYAFTDTMGQKIAIKDGNYVITYYNPIFTSVNLTSLEHLGKQAFIYCRKLNTVNLGSRLTDIPYMAFANCPNLTTVNLDKVVTIGYAAFGETNLKSVSLNRATSIGDYAFTYCRELNNVVLNPNGTSVGEGVFSYCSALNTLENFNKITEIGHYAFAYTDMREANLESAVSVGDYAFIKETETAFNLTLGENLKTLGDNPFAMCKLNPLYKSEEEIWNGKVIGEKILYTYDVNSSIKVINGSLYCVVPDGLELTAYVGLDKNGKSLDKDHVTVDDRTVRISGMAFVNSDVVKVTLPHSLNAIGHKAFYMCGDLQIVVFNSYDAPILEEEFDQNLYSSFENIPCVGDYEIQYEKDEDNDGKYDTESHTGMGILPYYMWNITSNKYNNIYYGASFVDLIGHINEDNRSYANMGRLVMIAPSNGQYYDSFILGQYFNTVINGSVAADDITMAAIAAINALPDRVSLKDEALVNAARAAYNKIVNAEQQALVTELLQKLVNAENLIKAYKNNSSADTPATDTPTNTGRSTESIALIILSVIEALEIAAVGTFLAVWLYRKHKAKMPVKVKKPIPEGRRITVKKPDGAPVTAEKKLSAEEVLARRKEHEDKEAEALAKSERNKKIKNIVITSAFAVVCIVGVIFVITKCSKDPSPYGGYENDGYSVSVKYDANGGIFTTNTETLIDTYSLDSLPTSDDGSKLLTLIDPNDSVRGGQAYLAAKVGYHLAGWYTERTEVKDENGNVVSYTYSGKWDFASGKYKVDPSLEYSATSPVITLYAAWVPSYTYEFYSVDENGATTLLGNKEVSPLGDSEITLPAYNNETGGTDANDFPYLTNNTYYKIYADESCTTEITTDTITHIGSFNSDNATVENATMKVYCKLLDGVHFKINSADQLIENAYLNGVYTISSDLDFGGKLWPAVFTSDSFTGSIIGNGHTIKNVTLEQTSNDVTYFGLFGQISGGQIKDVTFDNVTVNIKAGSRMAGPMFGIISGSAEDGSFENVVLKNSTMVIYTKMITAGMIVTPDYGIVTAMGSIAGVTFSENNTVAFSSFDDTASVEQVEYAYVIDSEGRFRLSLES